MQAWNISKQRLGSGFQTAMFLCRKPFVREEEVCFIHEGVSVYASLLVVTLLDRPARTEIPHSKMVSFFLIMKNATGSPQFVCVCAARANGSGHARHFNATSLVL
jgi:hypothetical protein